MSRERDERIIAAAEAATTAAAAATFIARTQIVKRALSALVCRFVLIQPAASGQLSL